MSARPSAQPREALTVVTLGVAAGPTMRGSYPGIATAVVVDGAFYLVDFGLGCTRAAHESGLRGRDLRGCFITHLHSDHVAELPGFLLWNWGQPVEGFEHPVDVVGPAGTEELVGNVLAAYSYDIAVRTTDESRPDLMGLVRPHDAALPDSVAAVAHGEHTPAMEPFIVHQDDLVTVSAVLVEHPPVFPSFAYRFDTVHGSVVLSGDTAECGNVVRLASGADLLVHEAVHLPYYEERDFAPAFLEHQRRAHTPPDGVGRVATAAGVPQVVLSHLAGVAAEEDWLGGVRRSYDGAVSVARPGQRFVVSPAQARV